jgi:hypothetical protein
VRPYLKNTNTKTGLEKLGTDGSHTCNPSYSGGRNQEDHGLKPDWANSSQDPSQKNLSPKKGLV